MPKLYTFVDSFDQTGIERLCQEVNQLNPIPPPPPSAHPRDDNNDGFKAVLMLIGGVILVGAMIAAVKR